MKFEKFGLGVLTVTRSKQKLLSDVLEFFLELGIECCTLKKNDTLTDFRVFDIK